MTGKLGIEILVLALFGALGSSAAVATPNATVVRAAVPLRESYPTYRTSTLFRFRLVPGATLTTIPENARVEVTSKKIVAKTQEWFEVTYVTREQTFNGWAYAGEVGDRKFLRLDSGVEERLAVSRPSESMAPRSAGTESVLMGLLPMAHAQSNVLGSNPAAETDPISTLLLGLAHVSIFIASLVLTRKWVYPGSNIYSFLTSLCILLILGFISETVFADLLAKLLAG